VEGIGQHAPRRDNKGAADMKVKEIMTSDAKSVGLDTNLASAAEMMWKHDCGALPVTDGGGSVVGMITDRDICIAAATRSRSEGDITVREVLSKPLRSCSPADDVRSVMETMKTEQIRRLPVLSADGHLEGIVSLHDIAMQARGRQAAGISPNDVLDAFISITAQPGVRTSAMA
jgi:CBS domain-containing protein